jgi:hypothetical protein
MLRGRLKFDIAQKMCAVFVFRRHHWTVLSRQRKPKLHANHKFPTVYDFGPLVSVLLGAY